jgi:hypothetical protein
MIEVQKKNEGSEVFAQPVPDTGKETTGGFL